MYILGLDLAHVVLLGAEDGAGTGDSDPADEDFSRDLVVLHAVDADQGASAAEASFAVNGDGAGARLSEVLLAAFNEPVHNILGRHGPVHKDEVLMLNAVLLERVLVILGVVQPDDLRHLEVLEDVDVAGGGVAVGALAFFAVDGAHEGDELAGDDPVEVAILDLLVVLVLLDTELVEDVPALLDAELEALQAVLHRALVVAVAFGSVAVGAEDAVVGGEARVGLLRRHLEGDNHEGAREEGRVR